jgi:mannosyltransferase
MEVIHGGVDVTLFHPAADGDWLRRRLGLAPSQPLILSPRLLRPLYNIDVIVRGFARVRANRPDARLVLLRGRHSHAAYANEILGLIGNLGLTASTAIVDEIPNRDMPGAYTAASVTVSIPSIDGTPMTALESMACGRPVVMGSLQDYDPCLFRPDETVAMTDPRQPDALAAAVLRVLDDAYYRQTLVQNALRIVHQHARDDLQMERLQRLYARLLADGESAP